MALFLGVMTYFGAIQIWHLLAVSALTGFFVSFEQPVRQSILHDVVPRSDLPNAITLYQMVFNGSMLFGPPIGGLLIPVIDTEGCFFVATAGNLIVLVTIFLLHIPKLIRPVKSKTLTRDMLDGLYLAWCTPIFLALFTVLAIVTFCTKPYTQFMPVFARDILNVGAPGLGLMLMSPGTGAISGGLMLGSIRRFPKPHFLLFFLATGFGFAIALFATVRNFPLALVFYLSPAVFRRRSFPPQLRSCRFTPTSPTAAGSCLSLA